MFRSDENARSTLTKEWDIGAPPRVGRRHPTPSVPFHDALVHQRGDLDHLEARRAHRAGAARAGGDEPRRHRHSRSCRSDGARWGFLGPQHRLRRAAPSRWASRWPWSRSRRRRWAARDFGRARSALRADPAHARALLAPDGGRRAARGVPSRGAGHRARRRRSAPAGSSSARCPRSSSRAPSSPRSPTCSRTGKTFSIVARVGRRQRRQPRRVQPARARRRRARRRAPRAASASRSSAPSAAGLSVSVGGLVLTSIMLRLGVVPEARRLSRRQEGGLHPRGAQVRHARRAAHGRRGRRLRLRVGAHRAPRGLGRRGAPDRARPRELHLHGRARRQRRHGGARRASRRRGTSVAGSRASSASGSAWWS